MFKQRVITALCLIPCVLWVILGAPMLVAWGVWAMILWLGFAESCRLIPIDTIFAQSLYGLSVMVMMYFAHQWFQAVLWVDVMLWVIMAFAILKYPRGPWRAQWLVFLGFLWVWGAVYQSMVFLYQQPQGGYWICMLLSLVWAADTGAYVVGKGYGRHRLIPQVSPGKTVEGVLGGWLTVALVAWGWGMFFHTTHWGIWFLGTWSVAVASLVGDLAVSLLKRRVSLKDTGRLLPGHGGVLDRIDSLLAAAPCFVLGGWFL